MKNKSSLSILMFLVLHLSCAQDNPPFIETPTEINYTYETIVDGIDIPWGLDFISENDLLVTEKSGILYRVVDGQKTPVTGIPEIYIRGQGGLLDIALHPDFNSNSIIYMTLSSSIEGDEKGGNTALYSAQLKENKLENAQLLYKATPNTKKGQHWGSRIVFDQDGHLFFSIGDRGNRDVNPQDITRDGGKIYRLNLDGSIPKDNPFVDTNNSKKAIYSYGHRNPQGMVMNPKTGEVWEHEHGPQGGDEINIIKSGVNFGWPTITYGINYSGTQITDKTALPDMAQPFYYWVPSIAPSGMAFSSSGVYKDWEGDLFVGSLKFEYLERLVIKQNKVIQREKVLDKIGRVREVVESPEGYLYLGVEGKGVLKIVPNQ
ncbi:MAG: PQQ-dependent sugar dehydrogenase [Flavobacteriaceae bacterium]|nr:PQQ-dependent sugar dehydrogenase [Flavobacteriaceae bacterium]MDG2386498.1 PQQ-dependent sugar dehydrogenase [Flavobacteriaceae bacterium]